MKRVICLLLSLILLLGLLPTALAEGGDSPNWVIEVNSSGAESGQSRAQELRVMYGNQIRFHLYEDAAAQSPLTGLQETFYVVDGKRRILSMATARSRRENAQGSISWIRRNLAAVGSSSICMTATTRTIFSLSLS